MCNKWSVNTEVSERSTLPTSMGLLNIASEGFGMSKFNDILEVLSYIILYVAAIYCIRRWCKKRKARKILGLRSTLSDARVGMGPVQAPLLHSAPLALPASPVQVVFHEKSFSIKGRLPSKVIFCQIKSMCKIQDL